MNCNYPPINTPLEALQERLLNDYDLRLQFNTDWRAIEPELIKSGLTKNEAMLQAIRQTRDVWLKENKARQKEKIKSESQNKRT